MAVWKQLLLCVGLLAVAAVLWIRYVPGADQVLANWGLDWAVAAVSEDKPAEGAPGAGGPGRRGFGGGTPLVITAQSVSATINDRLTAIGTGRALHSVTVTPFASGRLTEVLVEPGARVAAGTPIATLDSEAEQIALDRALIAREDASGRLERVRALRTSNTVTDVQVNEAQLAVDNAELEVRNAELALARRSIIAPISGVVGILPVSAGNYVTQQSEIATIDDRSRIIIDYWVPERFATMISVGAPVSALAVARASEQFSGEVSAIDNRVDEDSRTLRVQATIANEGDLLRAGMSFQVSMRFPGDTYPSVDPLAIQWGTDGAYIWAVDDGRARRVPVTIIQRNTDSVLISADLAVGTTVVTEGIHSVREGGEVNPVGTADADDGANAQGERAAGT